MAKAKPRRVPLSHTHPADCGQACHRLFVRGLKVGGVISEKASEAAGPWCPLGQPHNQPAPAHGHAIGHLPIVPAMELAPPPCLGLAACGCQPRGAVQVGQFLGGGGVIGALSSRHRSVNRGKRMARLASGLICHPGGGVVRGQGELGGQDLQHQTGLEPHVGFLAAVDPGRWGAVNGPSRRGSAAGSAPENPVPHLVTVRNRSAAGS